MTFGEKVRYLRKKEKWTQKQLAEALGLSTRTVVSYETGQSYPKQREVYDQLAELFSVDINYLYTEGEATAYPPTGEENLDDQIRALIRQAGAMFAGGRLTDEDKDAVMRALQEAYWDGRRGKKTEAEGSES